MRCPVAATSGLSTQMIASARERPALGAQLVELGDLLFERAAGERHAERALLERIVGRRRAGGLLLEEAARAGVLALLVAPDAVVRLVERAGEIHAGVGQREALAPPHVVAGELPGVDAVHVRQLERHELHVVELARRAEQHAALVRGAAFRRVRRPRGIAQRHVERRGVRGLVLLPARHRVGEAELGERRAERALQLAPQRRPVERRRRVRPVRVHRLALDELALDRVERRQLVVPAPPARARRPRCRTARRGSPRDAARARSAAPTRPCASSASGFARAAARRAASAASAACRCATNSASMRAAPSAEYRSAKARPCGELQRSAWDRGGMESGRGERAAASPRPLVRQRRAKRVILPFTREVRVRSRCFYRCARNVAVHDADPRSLAVNRRRAFRPLRRSP